MFFTKLKFATASLLCAGLAAALIGGLLASTGSAQNPPAKLKLGEPLAKGESDEAYIRRLSRDLRGIEPTPTEVHFFVTSKDASKRQKLIDLFIQERTVKQSADRVRDMIEALRTQAEYLSRQIEAKTKADKGADPLQARRLQLEAELKKLEAELRDLKKKQESNEKKKHSDLLRGRILLDEVDFELRKSSGDKYTFRLDSYLPTRARRSTSALQNEFFRMLIAAAKEKKDVSAITQNYLESLIKYIQDQPKATDVADAMLQIELVYRALGKTVEANAWREKLRKEHPDSPAAKNRQSSLEGNFRQFLALDGDFRDSYLDADKGIDFRQLIGAPPQTELQKDKGRSASGTRKKMPTDCG